MSNNPCTCQACCALRGSQQGPQRVWIWDGSLAMKQLGDSAIADITHKRPNNNRAHPDDEWVEFVALPNITSLKAEQR